ncbi:MAG TPA: hypothetical protein VEV43_03165 [Actinomycetota bacterium]|nr:hypothetical protein [Actinomycetota bacterium]
MEVRVRKTWLRLFAPLVALSLFGAACASGEDAATDTGAQAPAAESDDAMASMEASSSSDAPAVDTPAATLTRDLTSLLAGHEYHAGLAIYTAVQAGGDLKDPTVQAAVKSLDKNTQALAGAVGSIYGKPAEQQFLKLWRAHIGFFVDYTLGKATGNAQMAQTAQRNLDGYRNDFGALIEGATEGALTQEQVAEALIPHVESTSAAIDAVVAGDASAFDKLQEAAHHLPMIATALSTGISTQQDLEGNPDDAAAQLQRDLTSLLAGHEYHAGIAVYTAVQAKGDLKDPTVQAAVKSLDKNTQALAGAIGSIYGEAAEQQFLKLWRAHIGFFVDYTLGKATGNAQMAQTAQRNLDGYRNDFGALIEGATEGGLTQEQVAEALVPHVESTSAAIDAVVAGDASAFDKLQEAAHHLPMIATALAGAIVEQFPDKF